MAKALEQMKNSKLYFLSFILVFLFCIQTGFTDNWKRVYLASFPRSGNHWVRYLIEEATHIATSSVYCDPDPQHLLKPFPWGGFCCYQGYEGSCTYPTNADHIFIKTHFPSKPITQFDELHYKKAIRIVRNPIDSFYSKYVRMCGGKPHKMYVPNKSVKSYIKLWLKFQDYWDKQKNVITIRYEDLLNNPSDELKKILSVAKYKINEIDIKRAVALNPPHGYEYIHLNHFHSEDLKVIAQELKDHLIKYDYTIPIGGLND